MKALLGCLMCLVLTLSQSFAISGGPFGRSGTVNGIGTYAGSLTPIVDPIIGVADNSLGLFSLAISPEGLSTGSTPQNSAVGAAVIFRNGFVYSGGPGPIATGTISGGTPGIVGSVDPSNGKLRAVIAAKYQRTVITSIDPTTGNTITAVVVYEGNGTVDPARIVAVFSNNNISSSAVRIRGQASIVYRSSDASDPTANSGTPVLYKIHGFRQTTAF
jgi:hypothetical protein